MNKQSLKHAPAKMPEIFSKRKELALSLLPLGILAFFVYWQVSDHIRLRNESRNVTRLMKRDVSTALVGALNSPPKFGPVVVDKLIKSKILNLMTPRKNTPLMAVALKNQKGITILSVSKKGVPNDWLTTAPGTGKDILLVERPYTEIAKEAGISAPSPVVVGNSADAFKVMASLSTPADSELFPDTPPESGLVAERLKGVMASENFKEKTVASVVYLLDVSFMRQTLRRDILARGGVLLFCCLAFAGLSWAIFKHNKNAKLEILLARERDKNLHAEETRLMAAGLAHEIKNPLNLVRGLARSLTDNGKEKQTPLKAKTIIDEVDKVNARLNKFIEYSNPTLPKFEKLSIRKAVEDAAAPLAFDCEDRQVTLAIEVEDIEVEADREALERIIFNLLHNAIKSLDDGGKVEVVSLQSKKRTLLALEIRDNGPGIPDGAEEEIFKPYVSLASGTGLGLAIVNRLCSIQGWTARCVANPGKGAIFRVEGIKIANDKQERG